MATRTTTESKREITRKGDLIVIKEIETTTTYEPGKEPVVKTVSKVKEFRGEEEFKNIPDDVRRQLGWTTDAGKREKQKPHLTMENFLEDCLEEQNKYRKSHGVEPLKLSHKLIQLSQKRADEMAESDEMKPKSDAAYGENVVCLRFSDPNQLLKAAEIISKWYSEGKNYNYKQEPKDTNAGRFTQMIWGNSKEFGIAAAKSNSNNVYVVAIYSPPGNTAGQFKNNVFPVGTKPKAKSPSGTELNNDEKEKAKLSKNDRSLKSPRKQSTKDGEASSDAKNANVIADLNKDGVNSHNEFRKKHGVPPLSFSRQLAEYAQEWAEELARLDKLEHRKEKKYGENLYCYKSTDPKAVIAASDACKSWYDEIQKYQFDTEPKSLGAGHFTQMIWKSTKEVGMGMAKSKTGLHIIVANYNPPGNLVGNYKENIPKPAQ